MTTAGTDHHIQELTRLRGQIRRWRIAAAVFSVVVITTGMIILKVSATNLFTPGEKHDAFVAEVQRGLTEDVIPHVKQRVTQTVSTLVPMVRQEVLQLELRTPEIVEAVTDELQALSDNLPVRAEQVLDRTLAQKIREHTAKFKATYPEMNEEELVVLTNALLDESQRRALKVSNEVTGPYIEVFHKITEDLNSIRGTEITAFRKDASTLELAMVLIDVARQEIHETAPNDPNWTLLSTILAQAK